MWGLNLENLISQYKFKDVIKLPYIKFPETLIEENSFTPFIQAGFSDRCEAS
jgi:hypothetical protein